MLITTECNGIYQKIRKILKFELNVGNIIKTNKSRVEAVVRCGAGIISWTEKKLKELDRRTKKMPTIYGRDHP